MQCNAGHCQTTFHPTCARSAGFYMNVKTLNGKMQHMAYCEKHSLEQKAKVWICCLYLKSIDSLSFYNFALLDLCRLELKNMEKRR
jgi:hypothetical protein